MIGPALQLALAAATWQAREVNGLGVEVIERTVLTSPSWSNALVLIINLCFCLKGFSSNLSP